MKVLVIGQNGREHALAVKYAASKKTTVVFIAPGNGLTDYPSASHSTASSDRVGSGQGKIKNVAIAMTAIDDLVAFAKKGKIDLVDVAQDDCIASGYVDRFKKEGIKVFGPTQKAAQLEWDKDWARGFMQKYKLPIPQFATFSNSTAAKKYVDKLGNNLLFIKASGLALGKGVIKAENKIEAYKAIDSMKQFGKSGETFLIEEGLVGEEFSLFTLCDGKNYKIISWAQDHKTIFDKDLGPNTGGVGSVAPAGVVNKKILKEVEEKIIQPTLSSMQKEGRPYKGVLYLGGMLTSNGVKIIEFNARWGDPEAEVILPSITTDYVDVVSAVIDEKLSQTKIVTDNNVRISVAACAKGYPTNYKASLGKEIFGIEKIMKLDSITLFGSGIKRVGKKFFVHGGRILYVVAKGKNIIDARKKAYNGLQLLSIEGNNLHYRTDIGYRDVERLSK